MVEKIRCSKGHRFQVNRNKHKDRNYVICPRPGCHEQVKIRSRFKFLPNPKWEEQKLHSAAVKADIKRLSREKHGSLQVPMAIPAHLPEGLLALSTIIRKREEEEAAEKAAKQ